jgi:signal recognition particle receptor subunit beta
MENMNEDSMPMPSQASTQTTQSTSTSKLTKARHVISPYLPPPILHTMQEIDSNANLKSMMGGTDEPSMTIIATILTILVIAKSIQFLSFMFSGKAVEGLEVDDDAPEGHVLSELGDKGAKSGKGGASSNPNSNYDDSVILFGPSYAGKTCLFHTMISQSQQQSKASMKMPSTVMSLKADVSMLQDKDNSNSKCIRLVDYPGHITLSSHLSSLLYPNSKGNGNVRGLLVVDSTKSISDAAMLLYNNVLTNAKLLNQWEKKNNETFLHIMVVCNKSDASGAKNWRRVKIQLRSEMEKLKKISAKVSGAGSGVKMGGHSSNANNTNDTEASNNDGEEERRQLTGKSIDLDDLTKNGLSNIKMSFLSFSCLNGDGMEALSAFVTNGEVITDNSSVLSSRKR